MTERTHESCDGERAEPAMLPDGGTSAHETGDEGVRTRPVPGELGELFRVAHGLETAPETLGEWIDGFRRGAKRTDMWPPTFDLLCGTDSSRHLLRDGEETHYFHCVLDVLMAPPLLEDSEGPYEVESTTPDGEATITAKLSETHIDVRPEEAVISLGAARSMGEQLDSGFEPAIVYGQLCTYVNAFPSQEDYEAWSEGTPEAITMGVRMDDAFDLASELVRSD